MKQWAVAYHRLTNALVRPVGFCTIPMCWTGRRARPIFTRGHGTRQPTPVGVIDRTGSKRRRRDEEMSEERAQMEGTAQLAEEDENSSAEETSGARKKVQLHELVSFFRSADRHCSPSISENWKSGKYWRIFPHG
jgi:hypothetical protein